MLGLAGLEKLIKKIIIIDFSFVKKYLEQKYFGFGYLTLLKWNIKMIVIKFCLPFSFFSGCFLSRSKEFIRT